MPIRKICRVLPSISLLVVMLIIKKVFEDFGILDTGKHEPAAIHKMNTFPDVPLVLLICRLAIEICALCCGVFTACLMIFPEAGNRTVAGTILMTVMTEAIYISYRKTNGFFNDLEEKLIQFIEETMKGDGENDKENDTWQNFSYEVNEDDKLEKKEIGTFSQLPLMLA